MPLSGLVDKAVFRSVSDFINGQTFLIKARLTCINDSTHDLSIDAGKGLFNAPADLLTQSLAYDVINRSPLRSDASITLRTIT